VWKNKQTDKHTNAAEHPAHAIVVGVNDYEE